MCYKVQVAIIASHGEFVCTNELIFILSSRKFSVFLGFFMQVSPIGRKNVYDFHILQQAISISLKFFEPNSQTLDLSITKRFYV